MRMSRLGVLRGGDLLKQRFHGYLTAADILLFDTDAALGGAKERFGGILEVLRRDNRSDWHGGRRRDGEAGKEFLPALPGAALEEDRTRWRRHSNEGRRRGIRGLALGQTHIAGDKLGK